MRRRQDRPAPDASVESIGALLRVGLSPNGDDLAPAITTLDATPQQLVSALDPSAPTAVKNTAARAILQSKYTDLDEPACLLVAQAICRTAGVDFTTRTAPVVEHQLLATCRPYLRAMQTGVLPQTLVGAIAENNPALSEPLEKARKEALLRLPVALLDILERKTPVPEDELSLYAIRSGLASILAPLLTNDMSGVARTRIPVTIALRVLWGDTGSLDEFMK